MGIEVTGILGLIVLIADIWAVIVTLQSPITPGRKILWILLIVLLPVIGLIFWLLAGPRRMQGRQV